MTIPLGGEYTYVQAMANARKVVNLSDLCIDMVRPEIAAELEVSH